MLAIDYGTSRIKVAYHDDQEGVAKLLRLGRRDDPFIPSLIYLDRTGELLIGDEAEEMIDDDPRGVVRGLKRKLRDRYVRCNGQKRAPVDLLH